MKIRNGFVSNSSSSSFMIDKRYLSAHQLEQIENHIRYEECEKPGVCGEWVGDNYQGRCEACRNMDDRWSITEDEGHVTGYTTMDNFDMEGFLEKIGVPMRKVFWRHS